MTNRFIGSDAPDYDAIAKCIRCGMCLPTCPTYNVLEVEMDSPRGRIALIRAVADGRLSATDSGFQRHMYQCLGCRACETACPAGVRFGYLMEHARTQLEQHITRRPAVRGLRWLMLDQVFPRPGLLTLLASGLRLYQRSGLQSLVRLTGFLKHLPGNLDEMEALLPALPARFYRPAPDPRLQASGSNPGAASLKPRAYVALFSGCIQRLIFAETNRATERVLLRNGCWVTVPDNQTCCGALHAHAGDLEGARRLARRNIDAFEFSGAEFIVVNAGGCGAMLREYAELLHADPAYADRARAFVSKIRDIHELLVELPFEPPKRATHDGQPKIRVTYQDSCHLRHGQGVHDPPRQILKSIPGIEFVEMNEADWCCGSAGVYNITQPALAGEVLKRKMANVAATGADVIAVGNTGCLIQLAAGVRQAGLKMEVAHPIDLLDEAYREV
jgi:glycolate oxidase iron-sulfur subunit